MRDDFAVFILTHGRADNVVTYKSLRTHGYTGPVFLLVDDEDKQVDKYKKIYGEQVIVFPKEEAIKITDSGDNFGRRNSVVFARNWNFVAAKEMGLRYFLQLDDDYTSFGWSMNADDEYKRNNIRTNQLDAIIEISLQFLIDSNADSVAWAQGGDFIGGEKSAVVTKEQKGAISRKIMNSFFFDVEKPIKFLGTMNDDVNLYVSEGRKGKLFVTLPKVRLEQVQTQTNAGGLTDMYRDMGTYVKSFYTVMYAPSCTKVYEMATTNRRLHHQISWKNAVPLIVDPKYRKKSDDKA